MRKPTPTEVGEVLDEIIIFASIVTALFLLQGAYNLFESVRHTVMDGWTDHAQSHLKHSWPLLLFVLRTKWARVIIWFVWLKIKDTKGGKDG